MFLLFANDEVADEVSGIVGSHYRLFFGTTTEAILALLLMHSVTMAVINLVDGHCLARLIAVARRVRAIDKPILRRFLEAIATQRAVFVNDGGTIREILAEVVDAAVWVFDDETEAASVAFAEHLQGKLEVSLTMSATSQHIIAGLAMGMQAVGRILEAEQTCIGLAEEDARKERHY